MDINSDTEHTKIGVLYDISVHKSDLACIDAPASSGRARWANDVIVHLGDNISISTASSNKKHLLLIITPSELLSFTQHMFPNIDVVPILNLHKFGKSMGIPGMGLKKDEFKEAEFRFRLMFKVNDAMGHGLEGLHWNQAFYDIQKVKGIFAVNIAYYWMDTSSNNLNHPVVISIGMKMHKLFETVWPDAIFDGDPLSNTHQIEVPNQSNGEDCGFQSIELFRVLLPCKLQPFGDTTEFVKSTSRVTSDTINTARLNLKDNIIQKLQAKHQVSDAMELINDTDGALASLLLEPDPSSLGKEDGEVGNADYVMDVEYAESANDVSDTIFTHQELTCMNNSQLKEVCKNKGLPTSGKIIKLIDRILEAQEDQTKKRTQPKMDKKKRSDDAERKRKSRANQSNEKKQQIKDKDAKYRTDVRAGEKALLEYQRPTRDTKIWEVPGKDFTLEEHTDDLMTSQLLYLVNSGLHAELESEYVVAFLHVKKKDYIVKTPLAVDKLEDLYEMSVLDKVTFYRFLSDYVGTETAQKHLVQYRIECYERRRDKYQQAIRQHRLSQAEDASYAACHRRETPISQSHLQRPASSSDVSPHNKGVTFKDEGECTDKIEESWLEWLVLTEEGGRLLEQIKWKVKPWDSLMMGYEHSPERVKRFLEIHGYDMTWMMSIIGLRLSIPEWWWKDGNGNRYSKSNKLWKGHIVRVDVGNDILTTEKLAEKDGAYFIFMCDNVDQDDNEYECDEPDYNEYAMRYSDVRKYADEVQSREFILLDEMPQKYVDLELHSLCNEARYQLKSLQAVQLMTSILPDEDGQKVYEALKKPAMKPNNVHELVEELYSSRARVDHTDISSSSSSAQLDRQLWNELFSKCRSELLHRHASARVGQYIKKHEVTPERVDDLIAKYCRAQGLGLPWAPDVAKQQFEWARKAAEAKTIDEYLHAKFEGHHYGLYGLYKGKK